MGLPWAWGTSPDELFMGLPCDAMVEGPTIHLDRAVDCAAPASWGYRWLSQLALAPYSYDLVDNLGRRSPTELDPATEVVEVGQRMATVYVVTEVETGHAWTGRLSERGERLSGPLAVTYAAHPVGPDRCRLHCRMVVPGRTRAQRVRAAALAWGDLVMIRKQLHQLAHLAGRDAARAGGAGWTP